VGHRGAVLQVLLVCEYTFCKRFLVAEIVSECKHLQRCTMAHSKTNVNLISEKK
jgi:hypothetical protein